MLHGSGEAIRTTSWPKWDGRRHDIETSGSTGRAVRMLCTEMTGVFWRACVMREHFWHRRNVGGKLAAIRWARTGVAMAPEGLRRASWGPASGSTQRSEERKSELQTLMRTPYDGSCVKQHTHTSTPVTIVATT